MKNYIPTYDQFVNENKINEGSVDPRIKKEAISRLSDFFRVSGNALSKFNFDGKDNIKELTKALNSTSDQGTELYYNTAIKLAKEELGIHESSSVNEGLKVGDFVRYKKDEEFSGGKILYFMGGKVTVKAWDGSELEFLPKDLEYVQSWNESVNEGAVKAFEMDYADMVKNIKSGYGWIDPEFVADTWENTGNSISFDIVKDEIYNRLIKAGLLYFADDNDPEEKGKKVTNINQIK